MVEVRVGDGRGSGFLYPTPRHVVTAYSVINQDDQPMVALASGAVLSARVVAWSPQDGLAILELQSAAAAPPLELDETPLQSGMPVVCAGFVGTWEQPAENSPRRAAASPRFGSISFAEKARVGVDVRYGPADFGAPVLTRAGRVAAVLTGSKSEWKTVADATRAIRARALVSWVGKQGVFEPDPAVAEGQFIAVFVSPNALDRQGAGAGMDMGYRYAWFATALSIGFFHGGFEPRTPDSFEALSRMGLELRAGVDLTIAKGAKFGFAPGVALNLDHFEFRTVDLDTVEESYENRPHVRPLFVLEGVSGPLFSRAVIQFVEPDVRLDLGIVINR